MSIGHCLEVARRRIRRKRKDDAPFSFVCKEGLHAVLAHIGGKSHGIEVECLEESAGIERGSVAYVAAFGVGDDELFGILRADVIHCGSQCSPALGTESFIESHIGLIGHTIGSGSVDNSLVESYYTLSGRTGYTLGNFLDVGVETYTKERAFGKNLFDKFVAFHYII